MLTGYLNYCEYQIKNQDNVYFNEAIETIKKNDFSSISDGTCYLKGKDLLYHLLSYQTKKDTDQTSLEMHKEYVDFFYILEGKETMFYAPNDGSYAFSSNYDSGNDVEFIKNVSNKSSLILNKGMFAIFFPGELHISGIIADKPMQLRKLIFKIKFS